jgi:membrane protease YdiL (CAAX protease family)
MGAIVRVQPSVRIGIALAIGYAALFGVLFKISGVGYDDLSASAENVRNAVVIPLTIIAIVLIALTTFFGWWKPVLRDKKRVTGWLIIVPIALVVITLAGMNYVGLSESDAELLLWIGIAVTLVGFSEELMFRGLIVVSFRSTMKESHVWLWSSVAFSLLHLTNVLLGQAIVPTATQMAVTFVLGSGLYIARRTTGLLVVPMIIHLVWDYSAFTAGGYGLAGTLSMLALLVVVIALIVGRKHLFPSTTAEATAQ